MKKLLAITSIAIAATVGALAYNGTWVNTNPNTHSIKKLVIHGQTVKAFSRHHGRLVNLGRGSSMNVRGGLMVSWKKPGNRGHIVALINRGQANYLNVAVSNLFNNRRATQMTFEHFKKQRRAPVIHPQALRGQWVNINPNTRGVTRLAIRDRGDMRVRAWGQCHPQDCDWGRTRGQVVGNKVIAKWRMGYANKVMTITGWGFNRHTRRYDNLKIVVRTYYRDNSGRRDRRDVYHMRRR